jgi:hypothetical protein
MQFAGLTIGLITFIMIDILHIGVVRIEKIRGSYLWPLFLLLGLLFCVSSLFMEDVLTSSILGVNGFLFTWSGPELKKQKERARVHGGVL